MNTFIKQPSTLIYEGPTFSMLDKSILYLKSLHAVLSFKNSGKLHFCATNRMLVLDLPEDSGIYHFVLSPIDGVHHLIAESDEPRDIVIGSTMLDNNDIAGAGKIWIDYEKNWIQIRPVTQYVLPDEKYILQIVSLFEKYGFSCNVPVRVPVSRYERGVVG